MRLLLWLSLPLLIAAADVETTPEPAECVVLLHGLARTASSMVPIERALTAAGYRVANVEYPSRTAPIEVLAPLAVDQGLDSCRQDAAPTVHFVTHSLGGILVRQYLRHRTIDNLGRVVMLAPPNQGSEVVDNWRSVPGFGALNGPAGLQLGTDAGSVPRSLGPVTYPVGIIAGNRTLNPLLSLSLPNPDDGKVSVERTKVDGMLDFLIVPHTHTFIMRSTAVIHQIKHFLVHGSFEQQPDP
ncbi:MAG: alpha/beta fold hydrolase [Pseudomonadota bacterium]